MALFPLLASFAVAGGLAAAVLLLALRPARTAGVPEVPGAAPHPRGPRRTAFDTLPPGYRRMLERLVMHAGRPASWTPRKVLLAKPAIALPVALLALVWIRMDPAPFRVALALIAVGVAFFTPDLLLWSRGIERRQKIDLALPDTLDQMTISVEAGLGFESAMAKAATNGSGPLADELIRTLQDLSIGRARRSAYEALGERTSSVDLRRFVRAVIQADVYGIAIADVLRVQAYEMRIKRRQRAEAQAMKVPVKVLFPLMFCILPVLFIVILAPAALNALKAFG
ncbi:type II secretion system F family protein [Amnibacterium sp. CER49]|uniref:type II secretion system F family protein n=1 Tax=Amnibacterium sp. CER49 TaxID=3039161 RepID=UPI0024490E10|nr:type II secretion system F family protein [Amnibacterium sp. CER49]MDH2444376.1 type II secretion system F family protein [Amnibacterium sp. CER49]